MPRPPCHRRGPTPRHRPRWVDTIGIGAIEGGPPRTWGVERGEGAVGSAHVAMPDVAGIKVETRDCHLRVDAADVGALEGACAGAWRVKRGDGAVGSTHEAVDHVAGVKVLSRDVASRIDGIAGGALKGTCARAGSIERDEGRPPLLSIRGKAQPQHGQG